MWPFSIAAWRIVQRGLDGDQLEGEGDDCAVRYSLGFLRTQSRLGVRRSRGIANFWSSFVPCCPGRCSLHGILEDGSSTPIACVSAVLRIFPRVFKQNNCPSQNMPLGLHKNLLVNTLPHKADRSICSGEFHEGGHPSMFRPSIIRSASVSIKHIEKQMKRETFRGGPT